MNVKRIVLLDEQRKDRLLSSLLWGGVAAAGQFTMLFLSVIGRIHVRFENEAPVFFVDPRGPIALTKDAALTAVWAMTLTYGLLIAAAAYFRPYPSKRAWLVIAVVGVAISVVAAMAEPFWGLVVVANLVGLFVALRSPARGAKGFEQ